MKLIADALGCERNGRVVFSHVNFSVSGGESLELRGANGAGKSSLLRMIAGLVPQAAGRLQLAGETDFAQKLHFISHQEAMKQSLTVAENLQFWCAALKGASIAAALKAFHLETLRHDPVQLLSAGQRRRLALSRLFLAERPLWLLDEPMTALDATSQDHLRQHIQNHLGKGGLLVVATHGDLGFQPHHMLTLGAV